MSKGFGDGLDSASKTNADMKKEMNAQQASQNQQNVNVVNQNTTEQQNTPPKQKDTNVILHCGNSFAKYLTYCSISSIANIGNSDAFL